jgi:hypothetical protein
MLYVQDMCEVDVTMDKESGVGCWKRSVLFMRDLLHIDFLNACW